MLFEGAHAKQKARKDAVGNYRCVRRESKASSRHRGPAGEDLNGPLQQMERSARGIGSGADYKVTHISFCFLRRTKGILSQVREWIAANRAVRTALPAFHGACAKEVRLLFLARFSQAPIHAPTVPNRRKAPCESADKLLLRNKRRALRFCKHLWFRSEIFVNRHRAITGCMGPHRPQQCGGWRRALVTRSTPSDSFGRL